MLKLRIGEIIQKEEDTKISFRVFNLDSENVELYLNPHQKDHFCVFVIESGELELHVEDTVHLLSKNKIAVIFPDQVNFVSQISKEAKGKIILFEEVLFCSDILKNELSPYNVNLSTQLNCLMLPITEFAESLHLIALIKDIYEQPSLVRKEQARFYIKIFLLKLIESVHGQHPILGQPTNEQLLYIQFKKLLNEYYKEYRTVHFYSEKLLITSKKLNTITKKYCGETAINTIHNRIIIEIKRQLIFSNISHKEIAFDLGFNSPAALNKFVRAKLDKTPTQLQIELAQMYNT